MAVLTGGLWIVSWIALCIGKVMRPWRCEHCGWHKPEFGHQLEPAISIRATPVTRHRPEHRIPPLIAAQTSQLRP